MYKVKVKPVKPTSKSSVKKNESLLKDLLTVLPTLKKHGLESDLQKKVRTLRNGRKSVAYKIEVSRNFQGKVLTADETIEKVTDKLPAMKRLKETIRQKVREERQSVRPVIEDYRLVDGVNVKKLEVYLEPGSFVKAFARKMRIDMTKGKKPSSNDNYVGVEIELASKHDRDFICDKLHEAGMSRYVCIKDDGSIGRAEDRSPTKMLETHRYTHEITVCVKENEYERVIDTICKVLNDQCEVAVDKTCGLHVHIDMRNRSVEKAFHNLVSCQQFLYAMLPVARRNSRYSYPVKGSTYRELPERYYGINSQAYARHKTLEARMHCGTTQANKINNWIRLLLAISDAPAVSKAPTTVDELQRFIGASDQLTDYVKMRIAKFSKQHKGAKYTAEEPGTMPDIEPVQGAPIDVSPQEQSEVA